MIFFSCKFIFSRLVLIDFGFSIWLDPNEWQPKQVTFVGSAHLAANDILSNKELTYTPLFRHDWESTLKLIISRMLPSVKGKLSETDNYLRFWQDFELNLSDTFLLKKPLQMVHSIKSDGKNFFQFKQNILSNIASLFSKDDVETSNKESQSINSLY